MKVINHIKGSKLTDIMFVYHNGVSHKAISCKVFNKNITIYDDPITIVYCKQDNTFVAYTGSYTFVDDMNISDSTNTYHYLVNNLQKHNIQCMKMRDLITMYPDVKFVDMPNKTNSCNLTQLVYGIEYISSKTGKYKHAMLINSQYGTNKNINNNFIKYFNKMNDKLKSKSSVLIVTTKDTWLRNYPDSKIIKIQPQSQ